MNTINNTESSSPKEKLNFLVTSWGTDIHIDDVRKLTNFSSWTTGALITETILKSNYIVDFVYSPWRKRPFLHNISDWISKFKWWEIIPEQLEIYKKSMEEYNMYCENLNEIVVKDFYEYKDTVLNIITWKKIDVVILAMAVSDYWIWKNDGKIPSNLDFMTLKLEKLPKIISYIKKFRPDIFLVWFKLLTSDTNKDDLLETAKKSLIINNQDLVVANLLDTKTKKLDNTYIISKQWDIVEIKDRDSLPEILLWIIKDSKK